MADVYGRTALHRAVANGHVECAKLLLSHGAHGSTRDFRGRHALHMAATCGRTGTLALLISHITERLKAKGESLDGATASDELQPLDEYGFSPLHFAAYRGHLECMRLLLNCHCYKRLRDGRIECLQPLLDRFGSEHLTTKDAESRTVLHIAALCNQVTCLDRILTFAESTRPINRSDVSTSESGQPVTTEPLTQSLHIAKLVSALDNADRTALMLAASSGSTGAVERLLTVHNHCIKVLNDYHESQPECPDADSIAKIIGRLSLGLQDSTGRTALHHACLASDDAPGLLILQAMQDDTSISTPDLLKRTPLHLAISSGLAVLVEALIARGADLYAVDANGLIPVMSCVSSTQVATCLSLALAAMFPPLDGAPEHPFLRSSQSRSSNLHSRASSVRDTEKPDSDGLQLMSASMVQPSRPMLATVETLSNGRTTPRPLSYPGSESDFF
ncbi:unnamed protein product [Echinostoma caproni]|uniref:ANK_REP_REGION domain-containing protein n=1 Tax=Echinostoma caproni TaxID=27848 RepID=A0A183AHR2_9TREM|nr:unnamed protein product [Echinostoma caproni]